MPAEQDKREPLHEHDLELANHGGVLLRDAETAQDPEQASATQKRSQQTRQAGKQA